MHDSIDIKKNVYRWLNNEWNRLKSGTSSTQASSSDKPNVFHRKSFPCISPEGMSFLQENLVRSLRQL